MPEDEKDEERSFESLLSELESIVESFEADEQPLEALVANYEIATRLLARCQSRLSAAEKRIELVESRRGQVTKVSDYEGGAEPSPSAPAPLQEVENRRVVARKVQKKRTGNSTNELF